MALPLKGLTCGGRVVGDSVTLLVSAGVALVGSSVDDALAVPEGEVGAAVSGGGPLGLPGGGGSLGSMVGIVGWLGVVGEVDGGVARRCCGVQ